MAKRKNQSEQRLESEQLVSQEELEQIYEHPLRLQNRRDLKPKNFMRVASQGYLWSDIEKQNEMKPMEPIDVRAIKELKNFKIKIVDMGNACYTYKNFASVIQTRNYRGPEAIMRGKYNELADIWSLGCTVYEFVTGALLFRPKKVQGKYTKN
jgi:serine/threonine protein kinase